MVNEIYDGKDKGEQTEHIGCAAEVFADEGKGIFAAARGNGDDDDDGDNDTDQAFADDQAGGEKDTAMRAGINIFFFVTRTALCRAGMEMPVQKITDDGADDQGNFQGRRQVDAHADGKGRQREGFGIAL